MAISYNVVSRGEPGVEGGGEQKYYASATTTGDVDIRGLTEKIEKISTMSGGDIRGVLYSLVDVIRNDLADGKIVRLGELGYFRVSLSSEGHEDEEDVGDDSITDTRIIFTPGPMLDEMLGTLEFEKAG